MNISETFGFRAAKVPQRRYGNKFQDGGKLKPRMKTRRRRRFPKPKWMR